MDTPLVAESGTTATRPPGPGAVKESAWANTDALVASFSCSSEDMNSELASARPGVPLGERARSWVHEHQHLYHSITTPIGVFCGALRKVQFLATRDVLIHLRSAGVPPKVPLFRQVREASRTLTDLVRDPLTVWLDAELFLTYQQGSVAAYASMAAENPVTRGATVAEIFRRLQVGVARYLLGPDIEGEPRKMLEALVREELVDPALWRQEDRNSFAMAMLSPQPGGRPAWLLGARKRLPRGRDVGTRLRQLRTAVRGQAQGLRLPVAHHTDRRDPAVAVAARNPGHSHGCLRSRAYGSYHAGHSHRPAWLAGQ